MSSLNWFDAFRDSSGPLLYHNNNRIAATYDDVLNILIYICFITLFVAFLIISPGIRKERFCTTVCITISLFIGGVILSANFGTSWHVAESAISSPYRAFTKERLYSTIGVKIGLKNVNVTLKAHSIHKNHEDINYNERFYFIEPSDMKKEHRKALVKGLPYPILTITEYLSQDAEGFCWGRRYRLAGHYATFLLWISFATWILMNILLCAVPRYGSYTMILTGVLLLTTNLVYALLLPKPPLLIPFEGAQLRFQLGWCFWAVCCAGFLAIFVGSIYALLDMLYPNKFSTILEVDYDTPYRYFVGNDAHLLSAADMLSKSASSSKTNSTITSCCGRQMLQKLKSDASTSTVMSIPVNEKNKYRSSLSSTSHNIFQGKDNAAFEPETNDKASIKERTKLDESKDYDENFNENEEIELRLTPDEKTKKRQRSQHALNTSTSSSEDSEVTTTIIDGKRAVSIHNFDFSLATLRLFYAICTGHAFGLLDLLVINRISHKYKVTFIQMFVLITMATHHRDFPISNTNLLKSKSKVRAICSFEIAL